MSFDLKSRVILVTGGGSGIGRATALMAAQMGAKVAVADLPNRSAEQTAAAITGSGGEAVAVTFDVRDAEDTSTMLDRVERELGAIDGVVASAGISRPVPAEHITPQQWSEVLDVNLNGLFNSAQAAGSRMIARRRGSIVLMASVAAFGGIPGRTHYSTSKAAVVGLTKSLAVEWGRHGVRVNAVAPGFVDTPMIQRNIPERYRKEVMLDRVPLARLANAKDVAGACLFLISEWASYITGTVLVVDGGLTAGFFTRMNGGDYASNALLEQGVYEER